VEVYILTINHDQSAIRLAEVALPKQLNAQTVLKANLEFYWQENVFVKVTFIQYHPRQHVRVT
jgi:hypothetical protein